MATRYWVLGSGTWTPTATANWSTSSGGSGGASAPTAADTVVFDVGSNVGTGAFTVTVTSGVCLDMTFGTGASALDGVMTLAMGTSSLTVSGNWTNPATNFGYSGTGTITFNATSSKTITTNGVAMVSNITFNGVGGTWQLQGPLTTGTAQTITLTNGTFDLNNNDVSCGTFLANNTNTKTIAFGTGQFYLTASNTNVWRTDDVTNTTITGTNPTINVTANATTGTRVILNASTAGAYSKAVNLNVTAGSDIINVTGSNSMFKSVNFTGYTGPATFGGYVLGNLTLGTGMTNITANGVTMLNYTGTQTLTTNGVTLDCPFSFGQRNTTTAASGDGTTATITFSATNNFYPVGSTINVSGITPAGYNGTFTVTASTTTSVSYLNSTTGAQTGAGTVAAGTTVQLQGPTTIGSTRTTSLNSGTLNLNNYDLTTGIFQTNFSTVRSITTGTGNFYITGNSTTVVNLNNTLNFTLSGTLNFYCNYSGSTGARIISGFGSTIGSNFYVTAGTDALQVQGSRIYNNLDCTGFGGSFTTVGSAAVNITGNFVAPTVAGASVVASTLALSFQNAGTKTLSFSGLTFDIPFAFAAGTYQFQDAMTLGATNGTLTFASGTLQLKAGTTNTVNSFLTTGTTLKYLRSTISGTQATISQASGTVTATYLDIQDSNATGGAVWRALPTTNVNSGNNSGWFFNLTSGNYFLLF